MNQTIKIAAIVPAAGIGSRMQVGHPKQYLKIAQHTILEHTLNKLTQLSELNQIVVAVSDSDEYFKTLKLSDKRILAVSGGKERADSVLNALLALNDKQPDWVLVHDAARPLVTVHDMQKLITQCVADNEGGILASKVKDTIKRGESHSLQTVPRGKLWQALTPQFFPYQALKSALQQALKNGVAITDEASAMEWAQHPVKLISGRSDNIKITTPEDYDLACFLISKQQESEQ
ncbi:2-C-methyl-D-erythritol 4-phosphate cytidylyltransferase [Pseudoalteromonas holothuriae]|uniref:2-C-methyl-D-erythritol 4-phosphate cytidylyltransferase n=1 Tax=Pseudoalteromonas holothuriae TaxID=2963714 RepID=A0A9W4VQP1_9GAMM|nr:MULTISPECIES: 2-C-methyl-D-erythritol 4-phosphate cytidylyltransferase [unclassified Pseudoalteromonas]CAH9053225.1 2-C-methyl-D-erythritol 4-phosphate cytidylyltransferase [Pseudoalteromonas sp. CIP111951]CAH9056295.1 2-C-methyl-D-erythritol 4-phosphate cytidylyltransferase [Pseudoalteromonas sp. CIP111854]